MPVIPYWFSIIFLLQSNDGNCTVEAIPVLQAHNVAPLNNPFHLYYSKLTIYLSALYMVLIASKSPLYLYLLPSGRKLLSICIRVLIILNGLPKNLNFSMFNNHYAPTNPVAVLQITFTVT
jgi:hypothetical protein